MQKYELCGVFALLITLGRNSTSVKCVYTQNASIKNITVSKRRGRRIFFFCLCVFLSVGIYPGSALFIFIITKFKRMKAGEIIIVDQFQ